MVPAEWIFLRNLLPTKNKSYSSLELFHRSPEFTHPALPTLAVLLVNTGHEYTEKAISIRLPKQHSDCIRYNNNSSNLIFRQLIEKNLADLMQSNLQKQTYHTQTRSYEDS